MKMSVTLRPPWGRWAPDPVGLASLSEGDTDPHRGGRRVKTQTEHGVMTEVDVQVMHLQT